MAGARLERAVLLLPAQPTQPDEIEDLKRRRGKFRRAVGAE